MKLKAAAASLVLESVLTARRVVGMSAFEVLDHSITAHDPTRKFERRGEETMSGIFKPTVAVRELVRGRPARDQRRI